MLTILALPADDAHALKLIDITNGAVSDNQKAAQPQPEPLAVTVQKTDRATRSISGLAADSAFSAVIEGYKKNASVASKADAHPAPRLKTALDSNNCFEKTPPGAKTAAVCAAAGTRFWRRSM